MDHRIDCVTIPTMCMGEFNGQPSACADTVSADIVRYLQLLAVIICTHHIFLLVKAETYADSLAS